jgi:hypothetical protein
LVAHATIQSVRRGCRHRSDSQGIQSFSFMATALHATAQVSNPSPNARARRHRRTLLQLKPSLLEKSGQLSLSTILWRSAYLQNAQEREQRRSACDTNQDREKRIWCGPHREEGSRNPGDRVPSFRHTCDPDRHGTIISVHMRSRQVPLFWYTCDPEHLDLTDLEPS